MTKYKDEDIKLESITRITLKIMRDVKYADKGKIIDILKEGFELLNNIIEKDSITHYIESYLRYVLSVRKDIDKDEMIQIVGQISVEGSELVMSIAEQLRQEGIREGIIKIAKNAIVKEMEVEVASDFLINYLPKDLIRMIDIDTLEPQKESFLDEKLKEEFSDLLFRVMINDKEGYIYFLFEHKSYRDRMVIFQVLKYMVSIWEINIQENKDRSKTDRKVNSGEIELPIILPLVVYHDEGKWNIKRTLGEMIPQYKDLPDNLKKYIPDFEYLLFDLSDFNKAEVKLQSETMISMKALGRARHASREEAIDILIEAIELINMTEKKDQITYYVSACIRYMLSVRDDISEKEMVRIAEKISIEGGELVMSVAERLRQEGLEEGIKTTAKTMIVEGEPMDKIMRYTRLTKEKIEEIKEEMLN